ncbi:MAG: S53 family peptidase [Rudaea sp.]|nr:S53 family peptidase [Rudaea sp.]
MKQDVVLLGVILAALLSANVFPASAIAAQTQAPDQASRSLVTTTVDTNRRYILAGHRAAWATTQNDRGAAPADLPLQHLTIQLRRTDEREQAFQQLLKDQQDPSSPGYHHWLTPVELGAQFGSSQQDIDAVSDWLNAQGLHVDAVANSRTRITFSGTAGAVANALTTSMHYYQAGAEVRIANAGDPQIPAALSPLVQSIRGLAISAHRPQNRMSLRSQSLLNTTPGKMRLNHPEDTYCPPGGSCQYTIFPADFAKIYATDSLVAQGITGSGQTIAIVGKARVYSADLTNFEQVAGVTFAAPTVIVPADGVDPGNPATTCSTANPDTCDNPSDAVGNQSEATLDVERAGSVAPGASIDLIVSADINSSSGTLLADGSDIATTYAIDTDPVPARILSISFGSCESQAGRDDTESQSQLFEQAAAEGISVFVASGDSGAAGCEGGTTATPGPNQTLSINELCSSGSVTCVGGTEFADAANPGAYWASSDGANFLSALGYIPEGAWNDPLDGNGNPQFAATGGGVSLYIATPSWQTGTGVPGTQGRYVPDVSFAASTREGFFTCFAAGGAACTTGSDNEFSFIAAGGTSTSTPSMAGITALLNQKIGGAQGNLNPRLYALAATPANGVIHDANLASTGVSGCTLSTPSLCNNSTPGADGLSGGLPGYSVGIGYDEVTGLGSLDAANLVANWNASGTGSSSVNLDQHGITGSWYNPATAGQGFEIEVYPDLAGAGQGLLFAGWFTYDTSAAGGRRWYALTGNVSSTTPSAALSISAVEGGNFNAPPSVGASGAVGQATIQLSDCNTGTLTYSFTDGSGRSGTIPLARLTPNVTCSSAGSNGNAASDYLLSGNWYDPNTSGQGLVFDFSPAISNVFAAWYTFLQNGQQTGGAASQNWFTLQSGQFVDGSTSLDNIAIAETSGGVFNSATPTTSVQVGTANISFQTCNTMTLSYHFTGGENQGLSGTINLARVGPTPAGCSL